MESDQARFLWDFVDHPQGRWAVQLRREDSPGPVLALGFYTRAVSANPGHVLVWFPREHELRVSVFELAALKPLDVDFGRLQEVRLMASVSAVQRVGIPDDLPAGRHSGFVCASANALGELMLIASGPRDADPRSGAAASIYAWNPGAGTIDVYPQTWFTSETHDLGYEWITKAVRDPETGRILGDGVRIAAFELAADGKAIERQFVEG